MELVVILKAVVMGIIEGITELLPISSTGHLIIAADLMNFLENEKRDVFGIFIQMGATLAIVWEYRQKLFGGLLELNRPGPARNLYINVTLAFLPAALLGVMFSDIILGVLFTPYVVATMFILGGILMIWIERKAYQPRVHDIDDMRPIDALKVGLCQVLSLVPGTSRSGSTIIGGMFFGLSRRAATEFSFFLAIPMITGASLFSLYSAKDLLDWNDGGILAVGFFSAFVVTIFVMRALLAFVSRYTYEVFAWYRIAFGVAILLTAYTGWVDWSSKM